MDLAGDWRKKNKTYKNWDKSIRDNFDGYGIEKNAYDIFFRNIFVKD
jgi:hypothetical protein